MAPSRLLGGRYRLDTLIASGGMGEVWRAVDLILERPVAVKLLRPEYAQHEDDLARFRAEARHAGSVSHPGIAQVYDYHEASSPGQDNEVGSPGQPYLVMELVDGDSLARMLARGPLSPARTMSIVAQAARALHAAHVAGLVHRDIKPGNLLISSHGRVKITDFGISYAAGAVPVTRTGAMICTPGYLAPERAGGASATPAADLYSLGIVAFECLAGRLPFTGEPLAVALAHKEKPLPPLPPTVPAAVAALVASLTAKEPSARPPTAAMAAAWAEHLHAALVGGAVRSAAGPPDAVPVAGLPARAPAAQATHWVPAAATHRAPTAPATYRALAGLPGVAAGGGLRRAHPPAPSGHPPAARQPGTRRPPGARPRPTPAARRASALLGFAIVAALALAGWMMVTQPGPAAAHRPAVVPQAAGRPSQSGGARHARHQGGTHGTHVVADHRAAATDSENASRGYHHAYGRHRHHHGKHVSHGDATPPAPTPTPSDTPSGTPTPSPSPSGTPSGTPTSSASMSLAGLAAG